MSGVSFEQALGIAARFVASQRGPVRDALLLVRDLRGRITIAVDDRRAPDAAEVMQGAIGPLYEQISPWSPGPRGAALLASRLLDPDAIFDAPEVVSLAGSGVRLLDRLVTGREWLSHPPEGGSGGHPPRVVFYGVKGGVGRTTAASVVALELARAGRTVLAVDLDLESPGLSHALLREEDLPPRGLLDAYVNLGVGPLDEGAAGELVRRSPASDRPEIEGTIWVAPARGRDAGDFLGKLSRAYVDGVGDSATFAWRTVEILRRIEAQVRPDVVLIDSRAGLHDIAAVALTRLDAEIGLLFAAASTQTWGDLEVLFAAWNQRGLARAFRERLQVVAALVPELGAEDYLRRLRARAHEVFSRTLYDEEDAGSLERLDAFNFDPDDESAPHWPLPVRWNRAFFDWEASGEGSDHGAFIQPCFGALLRRVQACLPEPATEQE